MTLQALAADPNFIRLDKGAYSLHCFHSEREQLVKARQPKEPKKAKEGADGATPVAASEQKQAKEEVPMVRVEPKAWEVRRGSCPSSAVLHSAMRFQLAEWNGSIGSFVDLWVIPASERCSHPTCLTGCLFCVRVPQEVEKQYKEGTAKHAIAAVLKAVQPEALTVQGGCPWADPARRSIIQRCHCLC
jgi:hypothetical protein